MNDEQVIEYYQAGYSVRNTALHCGRDRKSVSRLLAENGVAQRYQRKTVEYTDEQHIRCSDCHNIKSLSEIPFSTSNSREGYYFSYCKDCRKERQKAHRLTREPWNEKAGKIKLRAQKLGVPYNLDAEGMKRFFLQTGPLCFYTDIPMSLKVGVGLAPDTLSVDRIRYEEGYVWDNIVYCTHRANTIKSNMTLEELKLWIPSWYERLKRVS